MTVKELVDILQTFDQDLSVFYEDTEIFMNVIPVENIDLREPDSNNGSDYVIIS
jgi:hypothetical protein